MTSKPRPPNSCYRCGSTSYRKVIARDENGAMVPTGGFVCTGCNFPFSTINEWRNGVVKQQVVDGT